MATNQFHMGGGYLAIGNGAFDSRYRYIRRVAIPADKTINMVSQGPSFSINPVSGGQFGWAWRCNGIVMNNQSGPTSPSSFNTGVNGAL